ncbi:MAG TPA: CheR family methyltransferase [Abditibacterium sp.]|jgi:chemotaxis protein methyltransferase CheR
MNPELFEPIFQHIAARTGLQVRAKDRADWSRAIEGRLRACRLSQPREYLQLLENLAVEAPGEWRTLLPALTNGESYFLRDKGQFSLLRTRILPELIEMRRAQRSLRLWSAGCSTGEEPYSLAMLAREIVPPNWEVSILGTDVNEEALQKARRGQYSQWSFRALDDSTRDRYFQAGAGNLEIRPELRRMVRFETDNLCRASSSIRDIDLILCRNVLIYFDNAAIGRALARFAGALREGGYLLTGHAEVHHHDPAPLVARAFPESVIYQRRDARSDARSDAPRPRENPSQTTSQPAPRPISTPQTPRFEPKIASRTASASVPAPKLAAARVGEAVSYAQWCQRARASANAGQHAEAVACCQNAVAQDAMAVEAYLLWAQVAQEQGDRERAKDLFKKVIYLAPAEVEAYVELGALYDAEGDRERARRMRAAALDVVRARVLKAQFPTAPPQNGVRHDDLDGIIAYLETLLMPAAAPSFVSTASPQSAPSQAAPQSTQFARSARSAPRRER